ncbi:YbgA family protein [Celerinatantimonas sp. YJH-8]|uniref:YbgA family protein n=1 Tax=Celerinatantimonas sp. YJH-8 TaxID=3228714 RepID=UPI0038C9E7F5
MVESLPEMLYPPIRLGVSACTIGEKVRFDGGHKRSAFLLDELSPWVEFVPVCPEVSAGLGIPRPAIRLVLVDEQLKVIESGGLQRDHTSALKASVQQLTLQNDQLTGFVFCAKSPSCGMERVKVYTAAGHPLPQMSSGIFAESLMTQYPYLPCEETGRLHDRLIRESFLVRLFCYARWQQLCQDGLTFHRIIEFHSRYKLLLMAHSPECYRNLGQMLAQTKGCDVTIFANDYIRKLMAGLAQVATRKKHTNVLMHIQGYFKRQLAASDKAALTQLILRYQQKMLPLATPLEMLLHYLRHYPDQYLQVQYYFQPYPESLSVKSVI